MKIGIEGLILGVFDLNIKCENRNTNILRPSSLIMDCFSYLSVYGHYIQNCELLFLENK